MIKEVRSYEETIELGRTIGLNAKPGDIFCLTGDLGTGKTILSKGIALGLGISDDITSPTFTIVNSYEGDKTFYHFDVYRINDISEMNDLGFEDMIYGDGVSVIEWAELVKNLIPSNAIWITIEKDLSIDENYRKIDIKGLEF